MLGNYVRRTRHNTDTPNVTPCYDLLYTFDGASHRRLEHYSLVVKMDRSNAEWLPCIRMGGHNK